MPAQLRCPQSPLQLSTPRGSPSLPASSRPSHPTFQVRTVGGRRRSHRDERTEKVIPSMGGRCPAAASESLASGGWQLTQEIVCILQDRARITLLCHLLQLFLPGVSPNTHHLRFPLSLSSPPQLEDGPARAITGTLMERSSCLLCCWFWRSCEPGTTLLRWKPPASTITGSLI